MVLLSHRIHFWEVNDQPWFPQFLREMVQSTLTLLWQYRVPVIQKASPAHLVVDTLYKTFSTDVTEYTYVDFCAGAGGPTPFIEKQLNAQLSARNTQSSASGVTQTNGVNGLSYRSPRVDRFDKGGVKFVLTDIHPHIPDWTEAAKKSEHLSFVKESVDAANAPVQLNGTDGKKIFRLYNLAFHHFDDNLGSDILRNTLDTADGFGIFELQDRSISSMFTISLIGFLLILITPFYFWRSPGHLFFTYIIPIIPLVVVWDGLISSLRTRTPDEIEHLMKNCGADSAGWTIQSGHEQHTWPTGYMFWFIASKK
ncbi:hypothetical protein BJ878DRAFT_513548 [Calycina marina]|uniref:Uncharacterized protein n=1 Tax=Calycina marina TaxID=1763456 RepID=A0A9P7Z0H1_9HELO|nr:hypothetical protein BJ878DRAFT_513548 [Calycina marina]